MKVGDLVHYNYPARAKKTGVLVKERYLDVPTAQNQSFEVLWQDGTIQDWVWDYDLKVVNESR
ncbi:hypothetical protein OAA64_01770 [bacterium]|nr:hypothetical protein [bacterium]